MGGDPKQQIVLIVHAIKHYAGIFHASALTAEVDRSRPRIGIPLGKMLNIGFHILSGAVPLIRSHTFGGIGGHRQRRFAIG